MLPTYHADDEKILHEHFRDRLGCPVYRSHDLDFESTLRSRVLIYKLWMNLSRKQKFSKPSTICRGRGRQVLMGLLQPSIKSAGVSLRTIWKTFTFLHDTGSRDFEKINHALMVLLPKHSDATRPSDFRPIFLVHSLAKIFSKVLSRRLAPMLPLIVSKPLHDNFILVRESAKELCMKKLAVLWLN